MTVLVVAAHPDDEILGCGGTIARHAAAGAAVHLLIVAEGATSRDVVRDAAARDDDLTGLRAAARQAAAALGAHPPVFLSLPDNRLDGLDLLDVVKPIEAHIDAVRPQVVYTHHGGDLNVDHRVVHQAVVTACRPLPDSPVRRLYAFETLSSTEWATAAVDPAGFRPASFVALEPAHLARKMAAVAAYAAEMRPFPHARSREAVESLARLRGAQVGVAAAEAFQTLLEIR